MKYWMLYFMKHKNDMDDLQHFRSYIVDCLAFELSKLRFRRHNYNFLKDFLKLANKCIIDEAGGVVGATPEGMGHQIFVKCENDELICFIVFLYHYIDSSVFLEVTRREGL